MKTHCVVLFCRCTCQVAHCATLDPEVEVREKVVCHVYYIVHVFKLVFCKVNCHRFVRMKMFI